VIGRVGKWSNGRKVGQLEESREGKQLHVFCSLCLVLVLACQLLLSEGAGMWRSY